MQLKHFIWLIGPSHGLFLKKKKCHREFSIRFGSGLTADHLLDFICHSWKKNLNYFYSLTRCIIVLKNGFIITKPIFHRLIKKSIRSFYVHISIDCWSNGYHFSWSFKWHTKSLFEWLVKFTCFLQAVMLLCLIWTVQDKMPTSSPWPMQIFDYHWISLSSNYQHTPKLLIFNQLESDFGFHLAFSLVNSISFIRFLSVLSLTFVLHFLISNYFAMGFLSWFFDVFLWLYSIFFP